jgi:NitT/TauT family transport system substrate-binding protein
MSRRYAFAAMVAEGGPAVKGGRVMRQRLVMAACAALLAGLLSPAAAAERGKPEKATLTLGLATAGSYWFPVYMAVERTWPAEGLHVDLTVFRGDAEVAQALAGGSIDVSLGSVPMLVSVVNSGQPIRGFYAGFNQAMFGWVAQPTIKDWAALKGKSMGISTFGSLSDALTRYALRRHGLDPEHEVNILQSGGSATVWEALKAKRLDAAILSPPFKWLAADAGLTVLGEEREFAPEWPSNLYSARTDFLDRNPNTAMALLRGHVAALRLARSDRALAIKAMEQYLKYSEADANRAYDEVIGHYDEHGNLPQAAMPIFWQTEIANHEVTEPWPDSRLIDRRFIDRFADWAP